MTEDDPSRGCIKIGYDSEEQRKRTFKRVRRLERDCARLCCRPGAVSRSTRNNENCGFPIWTNIRNGCVPFSFNGSLTWRVVLTPHHFHPPSSSVSVVDGRGSVLRLTIIRSGFGKSGVYAPCAHFEFAVALHVMCLAPAGSRIYLTRAVQSRFSCRMAR